jgi:tetratricopeptide (TPR) repeat protein
MTAAADRDDQVMTLMAAALSLSAGERCGYLRLACNGDESLVREIGDAVAWEERMGGFLRKPLMALDELERPFKPGQVVSNRFEIIREIGEGGMGIVYEAFDRKRAQRIAIKSAKLGFRRLLTPELESALKVRHPNVCLVNEIHTTATEYGDVDFLTMEFIEGPTLQARLSSGGKLGRQEALNIARQLCAGLAEAHRIGIIHKDLKSANVMLSRLPDGTPRAAITDFGLAGEPALESGDLAGTPQYMAPELWQGVPASKASDIYALGVLLYEMVAGSKPFDDDRSQRRLTMRPPLPSSRTPGLGRKWDAAILKCLDPSPAARPRDATEVLAPLNRQPVRKTLLTLTALLMTVAGLTLRAPVQRFFEPASIRLAILPVEGPAEVDAIGNGALIDVANRLGHRTGAPTLVVISASYCRDYNVHLPEQARQILDATHALQVSVRRNHDGFAVQGAVIDLSTRTHLYDFSAVYSPANGGDMSAALTGVVSKALRLRAAAPEAISAAAAVPYLEALGSLRRDQHGFSRAIPLFQQAIRLDPHSPLPKAGLTEALVVQYGQTGERQSLVEAERVLREAEALDPNSVSVLLAGGRLDAARSRYEHALQNYRRVQELEPRNVDLLLRIAEIDAQLELHDAAIATYRQAIALDPGNYETYEELGAYLYQQADYASAADQFRKVIERAPRFYNAYTNLGAALSDLGQDEPAVSALLMSLKLKETARALNNLAAIRAYEKRDADALVLYKKSLLLDPNSYLCLENLGDSSRRQGLAAEARDYYRRSSEIALAALAADPRNAHARAYVGYVAARLDDRARAEEETEQALTLSGDKTVIRHAVLTYEVLGERGRALQIAGTASKNILRELDRHPDLADFCGDPRFKQLKARI